MSFWILASEVYTTEVGNSPNTVKVLEIVRWLLWTELCFPPNSYVEGLAPSRQYLEIRPLNMIKLK